MSLGLYDKTYDVLNALLLQATPDLNKIELTMLIEFHSRKLIHMNFFAELLKAVLKKIQHFNCLTPTDFNAINENIVI